ncbi:MAG: efflux RND transporter permease subunit, partial [Croceimicrobium sp.]
MAIKTDRNFGLSTLSLKNSISVFILSALLILFGVFSYITMPKESFPEIVFPLIYVQTPYPGNTPQDIENLITRPLEKEIKSVDGIKNLNSESVQDVSIINVEFNIDVDTEKALQDVKDAVDRAMSDLPSDLDQDPVVLDIDLSRIPILNINLSGEDFSIDELVDYSELLQDEIEELSEISEATITGDKEKEVQINVDMPKLQENKLSFNDVQNALAAENINIGAGDILLGKTRRSIRTDAEFTSMDEIRNVIVKHENGNIVYLKDIADVLFTYREVESTARLNGEAVVSLNVIKKGGENLLDATDKIRQIIKEAQKLKLPESLKITITNDQSKQTRNQIANLENSIISGVILVIITLLFFLGLRNATFVGLSIPFSMFISFLVLSASGVTLNFIVLFSLILALGMLVDNAIVTIENIYRLYAEEGLSAWEASRQGVGEIAVPIISSTATTLAAFFPLIFWDSIIGEFMGYLPRTLIIVLGSSLFVALVINPVIAAAFIKKQDFESKTNHRKAIIWFAIFLILGILSLVGGETILGNLLVSTAVGVLLFTYALNPLSAWFQLV